MNPKAVEQTSRIASAASNKIWVPGSANALKTGSCSASFRIPKCTRRVVNIGNGGPSVHLPASPVRCAGAPSEPPPRAQAWTCAEWAPGTAQPLPAHRPEPPGRLLASSATSDCPAAPHPHLCAHASSQALLLPPDLGKIYRACTNQNLLIKEEDEICLTLNRSTQRAYQ